MYISYSYAYHDIRVLCKYMYISYSYAYHDIQCIQIHVHYVNM
jgi:hypothetical protein